MGREAIRARTNTAMLFLGRLREVGFRGLFRGNLRLLEPDFAPPDAARSTQDLHGRDRELREDDQRSTDGGDCRTLAAGCTKQEPQEEQVDQCSDRTRA